MAAHRGYVAFTPYALYAFPKFPFASPQCARSSQVWGSKVQVLTLDRKALPDLTPPHPSQEGHLACRSPLSATLASTRLLPVSFGFLDSPAPKRLSETHTAQALLSFRTPPRRHIHSQLLTTPLLPAPCCPSPSAHSIKRRQPLTADP